MIASNIAKAIVVKESYIPTSWKEAILLLLYIKRACSKHRVCNYRPVSLTSVVGKLLEAIVKDHIMHHLSTNNLLFISMVFVNLREIVSFTVA